MVYVTVSRYQTGEELRICRLRVDSLYNGDGTLKRMPGLVCVPECDTSQHIHFYYDRLTGKREAVLTDDNGNRRPFEMSFQDYQNHLIEEAMKENKAYISKPPYGFIRRIHGKRYPKPLELG